MWRCFVIITTLSRQPPAWRQGWRRHASLRFGFVVLASHDGGNTNLFVVVSIGVDVVVILKRVALPDGKSIYGETMLFKWRSGSPSVSKKSMHVSVYMWTMASSVTCSVSLPMLLSSFTVNSLLMLIEYHSSRWQSSIM